jgi:hypothetical protein
VRGHRRPRTHFRKRPLACAVAGPAFLHFMFDTIVAAVWRRSVLFQ